MAKLSETIKTGAFGARDFAQEAAHTARDFVAEASDTAREKADEASRATKRSYADFLKGARPILKALRAPSAGAVATELLGLAGYARKPSMARAIAIFGAGFAIGGGAAIFLAPVSGSTMRRKVRLFVRELLDDAPEAIQHAKDAVSNVKTDVKNVDLKNDLKKEAKHVVSDVKHVASEAKDAIKDRLPNGNGDLSPYRS